MVWAQLGAIVFETLQSPDAMTSSRETAFAEHAVIGDKPRLERTGDGLEEMELTVRIHPSLGPVRARLDALAAAQASSDVLPFVLGTGRVVGQYVVVRTSKETLATTANGEPSNVKITITLREWNAATSTATSTAAVRFSARPAGVAAAPPAVARDMNAPVARVAPPATGTRDEHPNVPTNEITRWPYR